MERNADDLLGGTNQGGVSGNTGSSGLSGSGSLGNSGNLSGTGGYGSVGGTADTGLSGGSMGSGSMGASTSGAEGATDRAKELAGTAQEKLADVGSTVRDRAGDAKNSLADMLATGADRLRERAQGGSAQLSGAAGAATTADGRMAQVSDKLAGGMQTTADWLRDTDMDSLKSSVEDQVKNHPGRTLLIAAGLGYLLGKAFRR